jgi:hypothetical protein
MIRKTVSLVAAATLALCAAAPASAITYTFAANLNGPNEPTPSTAFGTAVVTFDDVAFSVVVTELWAGLTGPVTGNHIHCCTATAGTGTSAVSLGFTGVPAAATGFYSNTFTLTSTAFATLLAGTQAGKAYVNLHTAQYAGGEIRGFLTSTAPVPEPGTYGMMLGGLGLVAWVMRRRQS